MNEGGRGRENEGGPPTVRLRTGGWREREGEKGVWVGGRKDIFIRIILQQRISSGKVA